MHRRFEHIAFEKTRVTVGATNYVKLSLAMHPLLTCRKTSSARSHSPYSTLLSVDTKKKKKILQIYQWWLLELLIKDTNGNGQKHLCVQLLSRYWGSFALFVKQKFRKKSRLQRWVADDTLPVSFRVVTKFRRRNSSTFPWGIWVKFPEN